MQLKDFMETVNYRVTEGSEFVWDCFGPNAYRLDSWSGAFNNTTEGYTVSVTFDTQTQVVYQMEAWDYENSRAYRWTPPEWKLSHDKEAKKRGFDPDDAWDEVKFVNLDVEADFLEKARAIVAGEPYDTRVKIELDLDDSEIYGLMKIAHERDITFNRLVEEVLEEAVARVEAAAENVHT